MCELVEMRAGGRYIKVAGIKKEYIQNIIESIHICSAIDKVVLFGSALEKSCADHSDVDIAIFGKYTKHHIFRMKSYNEFESEQHIRAWLIRVAINKAKNKNNTFFRRNVLPLEDYMQTLTFESEESSELFEAVMDLPEKYRIVIHLFYYEDYSVNEIAGILKLTQSNVKVRLSRGRLLLRNKLKEDWEYDE